MTASTATEPVTAQVIANALVEAEGNQSRAAELVGLNRSTFTRRLAALRGEVDEILAGLAPEGDENENTEDEEALAGAAADEYRAGSTIKAPAADGSLTIVAQTTRTDIGADKAPEPTEDGRGHKVTKCDDCGYEFVRPQHRRTCKVAKACERRQAARAAAAAAAAGE